MIPLLEQLPQWREIDFRLSRPCLEWLYRYFMEHGCLKAPLELSSVTLANSTLGWALSDYQKGIIEKLWKLFYSPQVSPSSTPFRGLTSIQGIELPLDRLILALAQCPSLEDITVPVLTPQRNDASWVLEGERRTTLPRLRSASFVFEPFSPRIRVLGRLSLPRLSKLYILSARGNFFISSQDLRDFLLESRCLLTSLRLDCENMPLPLDLENLLCPAIPLLGQLESLEITVGLTNQFFGELLQSFNPATGAFDLLPGLRNFSTPISTYFRNGITRLQPQVRITDPPVLL